MCSRVSATGKFLWRYRRGRKSWEAYAMRCQKCFLAVEIGGLVGGNKDKQIKWIFRLPPLIMWWFILHSTEDSWSPEKDGESRSILDWQWCRDSFFHQVQENPELLVHWKVTQIHIWLFVLLMKWIEKLFDSINPVIQCTTVEPVFQELIKIYLCLTSVTLLVGHVLESWHPMFVQFHLIFTTAKSIEIRC